MPRGLSGATVVVTRAAHQAAETVAALEARGASVIAMPLISIEEPEDGGAGRDAVLAGVCDFDWVVVTSPNGATRLAPHLATCTDAGARDGTPRIPRVAAVGSATESALGRDADLVAEPARASVLAEMFPRGTGRVLIVAGDLADGTMSRAIADAGWSVTEVVAYRTVAVTPDPERASAALGADVLLLASGSAARSWHGVFGSRTPPVVVCIGPSTAAVAESVGISVSATARHQSIDELVLCAERALAGH